jgi:hypothetical protein
VGKYAPAFVKTGICNCISIFVKEYARRMKEECGVRERRTNTEIMLAIGGKQG